MNLEEKLSCFEAGLLNRADHLALCKERALERWGKADYDGAFKGMLDDLIKHDGLKDHGGIELGLVLQMSGKLDNTQMLRRWITGFN